MIYVCFIAMLFSSLSLQMWQPYMISLFQYTLGIKNYVIPIALIVVLSAALSVVGGKLMDKYGAPYNTVAYTPSSWGQTGQYPQILCDFGINKMMFYRGISHDEADAEYGFYVRPSQDDSRCGKKN